MLTPTLVEIADGSALPRLRARVLAGDIVIVRRGLQRAGLLEDMTAAALHGIRTVTGPHIAATIARTGFDRIHEWGDAATLPAVTDAVYDVMADNASRIPDGLAAAGRVCIRVELAEGEE